MSDTPKDKVKYLFNPLTGQFDMVLAFNADRILTAEFNSAGNPNLVYDLITNSWLEDGPVVITDDDGNVVTR